MGTDLPCTDGASRWLDLMLPRPGEAKLSVSEDDVVVQR